MQEINFETYYAIVVNSDLTEGRGYNVIAHLCKMEASAIRLAKGKNVMGSDGEVKEIQLPRINERLYRPVNYSEIIHPTFEDLQKEEELKKQRELKAKKALLIEKLKANGYTEEELNLLK